MSDSTFYRAEIVIDINDEAAVQRARRAEERISRVFDRMERQGRALDRIVATPTISVRDRATQVLQRTESAIHRISSRGWAVTIRAHDMVTGTIGRIKNSLFSLQGAATVALGAFGATKLGEATVGQAAQLELQSVGMAAVLKSREKAMDYMNWTMKEAANTMFSDTSMMTAASSLTPYARTSIGDFKELMKTAEVLASINPAEGLEGGAFALREALSGDFVSLQERFNLPRSVINQLKEGKTTAAEYLEVVQKAAESLGYTYEVVEKQGRTSIGLWNKITGNINAMFRSAGEGILKSIGPRLEKIADWLDKNEKTVERWKDNLIVFGREASEKLLSSSERAFSHIRSKYLDNPAFQKLDFEGKVKFIFNDISTVISDWLDSGGRDKIAEVGKDIGKALFSGIKFTVTESMKGLFEVNKKLATNPSKETAGNALFADTAAVVVGSMLLSPGIKAGKGVYNAGKWAANKFGYGGTARAAEAASEVAATTSTAAQATTRRIPRPGDIRAGYQLMRESGEGRFSSLRRGFGLAREVATPATVPSTPRIPTASVASVTEAASGASRASRVLATFGKVASKAALPLAVATEAYDIYKAKDKVKASAQSMGGLSGAAAGAAIGSIVPVVGTVLGSIIGGGIGYFGGKWAAGKAVDAIRKPSAQAGTAQMGQMNTAGFLDSEVYQPFANIVNRADSWGRNLIGNFCRGRDSAGMSMSGWLNSQVYSPFASIVDRATSWGATLMNNFAAGMQSVKIAQPTIPTPSIAAAPVTAHAAGGILTRPHLGLVAEAGPEAIIPLSSGRRSHALQLWQQAGEMLGVVPHAEGGIFGSLKRFFSNDKVQAAGNRTENAAVGLESTRSGYEKAVHGIHRNYDKKIAKANAIEEAEKVRRIAHDAKNLSRKFSTITKTLSRIAIPLALFASAAEIVGSSDKKQTLVKELGSTLGAMAGGALAGAAGGALVGAGIASPLTALIGAAGGAFVGAVGGQAAASNMYSRYTKHADGGVLTRPHLGLVAEAGPEAIIPLSSGRRGKALDLWQKTGQMLGVRPYAFGGFAGPVPAIAGGYVAPVPAVPMVTRGGGQSNVNITVDGININMSEKEMEIDEDGLALRIGKKIVKSVKQALENRP